MSNVASFVWTSREDVCDQLAAHLSITEPQRWNAMPESPRRDNVAIVLARLAPARFASQLRALALDRREAAAVRTRAVAGLIRCGGTLSAAELAGLCDEPERERVGVAGRAADWARAHYRIQPEDLESALGKIAPPPEAPADPVRAICEAIADPCRPLRELALRAVAALPPQRAAALLAEWDATSSYWELEQLLPALVAHAWHEVGVRRLAHAGCWQVRCTVLDQIARDPTEHDASAAWAAADALAPVELVRAGLRALEALRVVGPRFDTLLARLERAGDPFLPLYVAMARVRTASSMEALAQIRGEAARRDMRWRFELAGPRIEAIEWLADHGWPADVALFARIVARNAGCPCGACVAYPIAAARALAGSSVSSARTELLRSSLDTAACAVLDACADLLST